MRTAPGQQLDAERLAAISSEVFWGQPLGHKSDVVIKDCVRQWERMLQELHARGILEEC